MVGVDGRDGGESPFAVAPSSNVNLLPVLSFFLEASFFTYVILLCFIPDVILTLLM